MPKKKKKLWTKINKVVEESTTFLGARYLVQLTGIGDKVWVQARDLSHGVVDEFKSDKPLSKSAQARVNRIYFEKQHQPIF